MPGLIRGVARTAVDRRDGDGRVEPRVPPPGRPLGGPGRAAAAAAAGVPAAAGLRAPPPPPAPAAPVDIAQLKELAELREHGVLTAASSSSRRRASSAEEAEIARSGHSPIGRSAPRRSRAVSSRRRRESAAPGPAQTGVSG